MSSVDLIEYLDETELNRIKGLLDKEHVIYLVKEHGGSSEDEGFYYKISVHQNDYQRSLPIATGIKSNQKSDRLKCPKCSSLQYQKTEGQNWLKKLWYWGTTPVQCKKCKTRFVI